MNLILKTLILVLLVILPLDASSSEVITSREMPWMYISVPDSEFNNSVLSAYLDRQSPYGVEHLPKFIQKQLMEADCKELDELSSILRTDLLYYFTELDELLMFLGPDFTQLNAYYSRKLSELSSYVHCYPLLLSDMYEYIDKYKDDISWHRLFGETGIYEKVKLYHSESQLFTSAWLYYSLLVNSDVSSAGSLEIDSCIDSLAELYAANGLPDFLIWQIKLRTALSSLEQGFSDIDSELNRLLMEKVSYDQTLNVSLLRLELSYKAGKISSGVVLDEVDRLINNFTSSPDSVIQNNLELFLRVVLFECSMCGNYFQSNLSQDVDKNEIGGQCFLEMLRRVSGYPDLERRVKLLIAVRVKQLLTEKPVDQWAGLLSGWDNSVILAVAKNMQFADIPDYRSALGLYDIIISTERYNEPAYAQMLYLHSIAIIEQGADKSLGSLAAAVDDMVVLLTKCEKWPGDFPTRAEIFGRLLLLTNNYRNLENADIAVIIKSLSNLLPAVDSSGTITDHSAIAAIPDDLLFYYASLLEDTGRYLDAAAYFALIKDQLLTDHATYHRVYCKYKCGTIQPESRKYYQQVIKPLCDLAAVKDNAVGQVNQKAAELLASISINTKWDEVYYEYILSVLKHIENDRAGFLVRSSMKFLDSQLSELQKMAASGSVSDFSKICKRVCLLSKAVYDKATSDDLPFAVRLYAELCSYQLSYNAGNSNIESGLLKLMPLFRTASGLIADESLAAVRINAFIAVGEEDYTLARKYWQKIRQARNSDDDYYYWEARFWGVYCLFLDGQADRAKHAIEVLVAQDKISSVDSMWAGLWLARIKVLEYNN